MHIAVPLWSKFNKRQVRTYDRQSSALEKAQISNLKNILITSLTHDTLLRTEIQRMNSYEKDYKGAKMIDIADPFELSFPKTLMTIRCNKPTM